MATFGMLAATSPIAPPQAPQIGTKNESNRAIQNQQQPQPEPQKSKPIAESNKTNTEHYAEQGKEKGTEFFYLGGLKVKITDGLLVLFTAILAVFTGLLYKSTRGLWGAALDQSRDLKKAIYNMEVLADATEDLASSSQTTAKRQLRAYVFLKEARLEISTKDSPVFINVIVKNSGQTPAHNVSWWFKTHWENVPFGGELASQKDRGEAMGPIAPNAEPMIRQEIAVITPEMHRDIIDRRKAIYLNGEIHYADVFGQGWTTKIKCLCTGDDFGFKRFRIADDGNEEIKG